MKYLIAVSVFIIVVTAQNGPILTPQQTEQLINHYRVCRESSGINQETIIKARKGEFADSPQLEQFFDCMFKRIGFIDDQGNIQPDVIKSKAPSGVNADAIDNLLKTCSGISSLPKEKRAMAAFKCYLKESPIKLLLFPSS